MVNKSPNRGNVPLPNGRTSWLIYGRDSNNLQVLTGMIIQVVNLTSH